jgi:hypothetical protein
MAVITDQFDYRVYGLLGTAAQKPPGCIAVSE